MSARANFPAWIADAIAAALIAYVGTSSLSHRPHYTALVEILAASAITHGRQYFSLRRPSLPVVLSGLTVILAGLALLSWGSGGPTVIGLTGWGIFAYRRLQSATGRGDNELQIRRFVWDVIILAALLGLNALLKDNSTISITTMIFGFGVILGRLAAMHRAQVAEDGATAFTSRLSIVFAGLAAVLIAILVVLAIFPDLRTDVLIIGLGFFTVYIIIALWRDLAAQLVATAILLLFLVVALKLFAHGQKNPHGTQGGIGAFHLHFHQSTRGFVLPPIDWGLVLLALGVAVAVMVILRVRRTFDDAVQTGDGITMERTRLANRRQGGSNARRSPLRQAVMRYLRREARRGRPIASGETLRQYVHRLGPHSQDVDDAKPTAPDYDDTLQIVVEQYERERYGLHRTAPQIVSELRHKLHL